MTRGAWIGWTRGARAYARPAAPAIYAASAATTATRCKAGTGRKLTAQAPHARRPTGGNASLPENSRPDALIQTPPIVSLSPHISGTRHGAKAPMEAFVRGIVLQAGGWSLTPP